MDLALKSMQELMKQHIIGNPKDRMAVIFYAAVSFSAEAPGCVNKVRGISTGIGVYASQTIAIFGMILAWNCILESFTPSL